MHKFYPRGIFIMPACTFQLDLTLLSLFRSPCAAQGRLTVWLEGGTEYGKRGTGTDKTTRRFGGGGAVDAMK